MDETPIQPQPELPEQPDIASGETAAVYVPANRLARVDAIQVNTPLGNRIAKGNPAEAPTAKHKRDATVTMVSTASKHGTTASTLATSVLRRLHGSDSDELFGAALRSKQQSLINGDISRFSLVGKLGEGSQGIVYRVNDRDCHREVACKVLSYATTDPEEISRFIHEAQVTAQLEHPGIVPIHDLGELRDGTVYYTMKRVEGKSLGELLEQKSGKPQFRYELLQVFLRICETLSFAHSRGVIHRDLKPRNIMVGQFGEVLVMDWGLAKVINCPDVVRPMASMRTFPEADAYRTLNGTAVGTPAYMSPEQAMGEVDTLDRRCDIYALGVILYEMLAGESPYVRGEARKVMHQVSHGLWTRLNLRPIGAKLPKALIAIVHRAMAYERDERYQWVDELVRDVRNHLAGSAVSAYRETWIEQVGRVFAHHKRQVRVGVIAAAIVGAIAGGFFYSQWQEEEEKVATLRTNIDQALSQRNFVDASAILEKILALRPNDQQMLQKRSVIADELRKQEFERLEKDKRTHADKFLEHANLLAASNDTADLVKAGELYMNALGLVPDDQSIAELYKQLSHKIARIEQEQQHEKLQKERDENGLKAADRALSSAQTAIEKMKAVNDELISNQQKLNNLFLNGSEGESTRFARHKLEQQIDEARVQLAEFKGRAAEFIDTAVSLAPKHEPVRRMMADFYLERLLEYEANGNVAEARIAQMRCDMYDDGRYTDILIGLGSLQASAEHPPITIQRIDENNDRIFEATGESILLEAGQKISRDRGRYLISNEFGAKKSIELRRGEQLTLMLPIPPELPPNCIYIPGGTVRTDTGIDITSIAPFGLTRHEITCGEYLEFLNSSPIQQEITEAKSAGISILVPRLQDQVLWIRSDDGTINLQDTSGMLIDARWPVSCISARDVVRYLAWRKERDQIAWRLPTSLEWQLAAQSGDHRTYPWGMRADLSFTNNPQSSSITPWCQAAVGSHKRDRTVHDVMDLAGSVAELVTDAGVIRHAAGGSYRDRLSENYTVYARRDIRESDPDPSVGFRLALTLPITDPTP